MEEELKCPVCVELFEDPVILPCSHNVCLKCAENLISKHKCETGIAPSAANSNNQQFVNELQSDKASVANESVLSDTDSGYSGNSGKSGSGERKNPLILPSAGFDFTNNAATRLSENKSSTLKINQSKIRFPILPKSVKCLTCPVCYQTLFLDERGACGLAKHQLLQNIIGKFSQGNDRRDSKPNNDCSQTPGENHLKKPPFVQQKTFFSNFCQMCDKTPPDKAVAKCIQCDVIYCEKCREICHPARGPLANHSVVTLPGQMQSSLIGFSKTGSYRRPKFAPLPNKPSPKSAMKLLNCTVHPTEKMSLHCLSCKASMCVQCQADEKHKSHDVKPIGALYRRQKGELSSRMSTLSNKARQARELVMVLRDTQENLKKLAEDLERKTISQCDVIIEAVERKKKELIQRIEKEKEAKHKVSCEQLQMCTTKLKQTTGLLEYCIEVMKEDDAVAFLQTSQALSDRLACTERQWTTRTLTTQVKCDIPLHIDTSAVALAVEKLDFMSTDVPGKPSVFVVDRGNTTATLSWIVPSQTEQADGYKLEMDNGCSGKFREVYVGPETVCTVDGLHFNTVYKVRVAAFNKSGQGCYSEIFNLKTSEAATFQFNFSDMCCSTVPSNNESTEVVLANVGFSKGVHYWEFIVERYDGKSEPSFGVALADVNRSKMLGKDAFGWSMYAHADCNWLLHNSQHLKRNDVGIQIDSKIGVLLDLNRKLLSLYLNNAFQGSLQIQTRKHGLQEMFYPAMSVKNVQVTLRTGLPVPIFNQKTEEQNSFNTLAGLSTLTRSASLIYRSPRNGFPPPPPPRRSSCETQHQDQSKEILPVKPKPSKSFMSFFHKI